MIMLACRMIVYTLKIFLGMQDNNVIYSLKLNMVGFRSSTIHYSSALWQCYRWVIQFLYKMQYSILKLHVVAAVPIPNLFVTWPICKMRRYSLYIWVPQVVCIMSANIKLDHSVRISKLLLPVPSSSLFQEQCEVATVG